MKGRDFAELLLLAAIWGGSFLFTRMAAGEMGAIALAGCRVIGAAAFLLPWVIWQGQLRLMREHAGQLMLVGLTNSALPFLCYSFAALALTGGMSAIFNASTPLWTAVIAWLWLGERPKRGPVLGLFIGMLGVLWLVADQADFRPGATGVSAGLAVLACLAAPLMYGFSANLTRKHIQGVPPMVLATGSQVAASLWLLLPTVLNWPSAAISSRTIWATVALAFLCTGVAYVLFFRLIQNVGASKTVTVTFLIPVFAVAWGHWLLAESVTLKMALACGVILLGTGLVTGLIGWPEPRSSVTKS